MRLLLHRFCYFLRLAGLSGLLLVLTIGSGRAQAPFFGPILVVGNGASGAETYAGRTATDAQGNVYVVGTFGGRLLFGTQPLNSRLSNLDVLVVKYDAVGNYQWAVSAGGDLPDHGTGLALDASGNVYLTGTYASPAQFGAIALPAPAGRADVFVAKLDPAGNWLWAINGGGPADDYSAALAVDAAGTLTVAGSFGGASATFGAASLANPSSGTAAQAGFVARLSLGGNWLTANAIVGLGTTVPTGVVLDAAGSAYVCGSFAGASVAFGSTTLPNANANASTTDSFVAKLTPAGSWQWATRGGGPGNDRAQALVVDGSGLVYLTGGFSGSAAFGATTLASQGTASDIYVAALDATGAWRWATRAGGSDDEAGSDLALDGTGRLVITGEFFSPSAQFGPTSLALSGTQGQSDAFIAKLDAAGTWQWALGSSGAGEEIGHALALDIDGGMYLMGTYLGAGQLGTIPLPGTQPVNKVFLTKVYDKGPLAVVNTLVPGTGVPGQTVAITGSGFVGVTAVLFNGRLAASFAVQSPTQLTAVVPAGVTTGPVSVRTAAGTGISQTVFTPTALSSAVATAHPGALSFSPNPATHAIFIPGLPAGTRVQLLDALGRVARETIGSVVGEVSVLGLVPGLYTLRVIDAQGFPQLGRVLIE